MASTRRSVEELTLAPLDNRALANLCGPLDANLRQIEAALDVAIAHRGGDVHARPATPAQTAQARAALAALLRRGGEAAVGRRHPARPGRDRDARRGAQPARRRGCGRRPLLRTRRADLHGRTPNQIAYLKAIQSHDITFGIGPAGTGKTYLAVACAVDALERDAVKRIVLVRPAVEAGERLGFLPGDLAQKVDPYLRPLYDALYDLMGFDKAAKLFERSTIEIAPLAYMRGRTLNHSVHHPRRGAEHHARADEDVPDAHRLRHQGRHHRRRHADRPRARAEERADRGGARALAACAASRSCASPAPTSSAIRSCRRSSTPTSATTRRSRLTSVPVRSGFSRTRPCRRRPFRSPSNSTSPPTRCRRRATLRRWALAAALERDLARDAALRRRAARARRSTRATGIGTTRRTC